MVSSISYGENSRIGGLGASINRNPSLANIQAALLGQLYAGNQADANNNQISIETLAVA